MPNANRSFRRRAFVHAIGAVTLAVVETSGCVGTTTTAVSPYDEAYLYTAYYPDTLTYSTYYWADDWGTSAVYYAPASAVPITSDAAVGQLADAGARDGQTVRGLAAAIAALSTGASICPDQVTIEPKTASPACDGGPSPTVRNGVMLTFTSCRVGSQTIDGVVALSSMRTASDPQCGPATTISLRSTMTLTAIAIRPDAGGRILIPSQSVTATASYTYGQRPDSVQAVTSGQVQVFDTSNVLTADITFDGSGTFTFGDGSSLVTDGTATFQDTVGATATITKTRLARSAGCCRPTGGALIVDRIGGPRPGRNSWTFGPDCGAATRNDTDVNLPTCVE